MKNSALGILIMAAGKGTRMKSDLPKVLHPILDKPMLGYLLKTVFEYASCGDASVEIAVLVGHEGGQVCDYLKKSFPTTPIEILWQREQLGTGHAVRTAQDWWKRFDHVLVLNGDLPLLKLGTLQFFLKEHFDASPACSLLSFVTDFPDGYGRVMRHKNAKAEDEVSIVEHKDATPQERLVKEVNAGCYVFGVGALAPMIERLKNENSQGEYYLPDVVSLMSEAKMSVRATLADAREMLGINTQAELAETTELVRNALIEDWMGKGVRILDPSAVWIGPDVELAPDVRLMPGVQIWGNTAIGEGSSVGPYCILQNARLGRRVNLIANVIVENSELCDDAKAGPFAYIRESSRLEERAFAGKFVELKKTTVGRGSKVPHLSYMGDATLGENVNIGAGCVTCNYDGKNKFSTEIGDRCFVGSDTMLVAPVSLGDDSMTAAGSTITQDIPDGALGVGRARQRNIADWVYKKRQSEK